MASMLVTRPRHDLLNEYLFHWTAHVIMEAKNAGIDISDVVGEHVTKKEVVSRLQKKKHSFVFLNGHGNEKAYGGHNNETVLSDSNAARLTGTISFARSCNCLIGLGSEAIKTGCRAFVGYTDYFWLPRQNEYNATPLADPVAKPVLEASNEVALSLIHGKTVAEAVVLSHRMVHKSIEKLVYSEDLLSRPSLKALLFNDAVLAAKGDLSAKIR